MRHYIVITTLMILIGAFLVAIAWFIASPDYEPALTSLVLLATIIGLFIDRWLSERERRRQLLHSLVHEIYMNIGVFDDLNALKSLDKEKQIHIFPRFYTFTLTAVIASGAFSTKRDKKLWKLLNGWLQRVIDANNRLHITELQTFSNPNIAEIFYAKLSTGNVMVITKQSFLELANHLFDTYKTESGIDRNTILFDVGEKPDLA